MKYQDYFKQSRFKDIWKVLHYVYNEPIETQSLYEELVKDIQLLSIQDQFPCEAINVSLDEFNNIFVGGAPDPQEWLVEREVIVDIPNADVSIAEVAAHLLYWSTLYAIKTQTTQRNDFSQWLQESMAGPRYDAETGLMDKFIFLDFDGVLNTEQNRAERALTGKDMSDEFGPLFSPKSVSCLGEIIERTNAQIVVSSSWSKLYDLDEIRQMWALRGLPGKIYGNLADYPEGKSRGEAIAHFMKYYGDTPYIILDDKDDFLTEQKENFIRVNPVTGISKKDAELAIAKLNELDDMQLEDFIDKNAYQERKRRARIEEESSERKRLRFWRNTIVNDSPIDWSWNLSLLKKKLEYNIGYWRYVQRHSGWEEDVKRMQLCCHLLYLAASDYPDMEGVYVNARNAARYGVAIKDDEFREFHLTDLRKEKTYHLIWQFIEHNLRKWWN